MPSLPNPEKWNLAGESMDGCGPGHVGNGQRCAKNATVVDGILQLVGEENGDTGWLKSRFAQQYGRWEVRARSSATGGDGEQYHPVLITWPDDDDWPAGAEYDYLENGAPGEECAGAFIHYPHPGDPVQQEHAEKCGVDLTQWHNFGFEWTPDHVKGFIDGEEWFTFSGGESGDRSCIQCAPGPMAQTIQLDNFNGDSGNQEAIFEVDWARVYEVSGSSTGEDAGEDADDESADDTSADDDDASGDDTSADDEDTSADEDDDASGDDTPTEDDDESSDDAPVAVKPEDDESDG
jgi:hypothetical protein